MHHSYKHGHSVGKKRGKKLSKEYIAWQSMIRRTCYPKHHKWDLYGGRGITIAPEWRHDFLAFYDHLGPAPSPAHSIDRIDPDGNYEPGNVRWATGKEQYRNRRFLHAS